MNQIECNRTFLFSLDRKAPKFLPIKFTLRIGHTGQRGKRVETEQLEDHVANKGRGWADNWRRKIATRNANPGARHEPGLLLSSFGLPVLRRCKPLRVDGNRLDVNFQASTVRPSIRHRTRGYRTLRGI
jgi:hypothetical protein